MRNNTIDRKIGYLKGFLKWAEEKEYYTEGAHKTFKPRIIDPHAESREIIYLTWDELMQLYNFNFDQNYLKRIRDFFCFECFTGLRFSDVYKLKKNDINDDTINVITKKTSDNLTIPLNKYSRAILKKYSDTDSEFALPSISNQKANVYLKEAAKMAGINSTQKVVFFSGTNRVEEYYEKWQVITTHAGRRTFVVNALTLEIPVEVIMRITGHKNIKDIKPYAKITDELKKNAMRKFDNK